MGRIKIIIFFLLVSASPFPTSIAGRVVYNSAVSREATSATHEENESWEAKSHGKVGEIHERVLNVVTNDYGTYDPAPSMAKPRFKLIPN